MSFDEVRMIVLQDRRLALALAAVKTETELFDAVIGLARERGIHVTTEELAEVVRANRKAWLERWLFP